MQNPLKRKHQALHQQGYELRPPRPEDLGKAVYSPQSAEVPKTLVAIVPAHCKPSQVYPNVLKGAPNAQRHRSFLKVCNFPRVIFRRDRIAISSRRKRKKKPEYSINRMSAVLLIPGEGAPCP